MKKALLAIGVLICFMVAADKIYNFYQGQKPAAEVGECLQVQDPNVGPVQIEITANNSESKTSDIVISFEVMPGARIYAPARVSYQDLRDSGAVKVECIR